MLHELEREARAEKNGTAFFPGPAIQAVRGKKAQAEHNLRERRLAALNWRSAGFLLSYKLHVECVISPGRIPVGGGPFFGSYFPR